LLSFGRKMENKNAQGASPEIWILGKKYLKRVASIKKASFLGLAFITKLIWINGFYS